MLMTVLRRVLQLDDDAASSATRGFALTGDHRQALLERHGRSFVNGYNAALTTDDPWALAAALATVPAPERGFAYEGAGMASTLLDLVVGGHRLVTLLEGHGRPWRYLVHVGSGWAMARVRRRPRPWPRLDPLLRWLAFDGWGFHDGYFNPRRAIVEGRRPRHVREDERAIFDQGLGRSLWFAGGADSTRVIALVNRFAPHRHADLWAGVGLACVYAGGARPSHIADLRTAAGPHARHLAQGAAFAAKARLHAGPAPAGFAGACTAACGRPAEEAAALTDRALAGLHADGTAGDYDRWRGAVRSLLVQPEVAA